MNVLVDYLSTMFSGYPQTPRLLEAKAELQGMMEDAYAALIAQGCSENEAIGRVISDFGNLDEVAPVLGITSELHASITTGASTEDRAAADGTPLLPITMDEARDYAEAERRATFRVARAISLFILSPAVLIVGILGSKSGLLPFTSEVVTFVGILILLGLVVAGLAMIFTADGVYAAVKRIQTGRFSRNPEVSHWAESLAERHDPTLVRALIVAVALWILAPVPLIAFSLFADEGDGGQFWTGIFTAVILLLVAAGLEILMRNAWPRAVAEKLTHSKRTRSHAQR